MKKHLWFLFVGLVTAVVFVSTSSLYAAQKIIQRKNAISKSMAPGQKNSLPDLVVKNVSWSSNPKAGDTVGASSILHITVLNKGTVSAGASKLRIECKSLTGTNYPYPLDGMIEIQSLGPGKSMTYAWPPSSSEKWFPGTYRMDFTADYAFNKVAESNETNNKKTLTFTVLAKSTLIKKIKAKPIAMPQLNTDLEIVSVTMTPDNPVSGQTVSVTAVVKNSGKVKTPEVDSKFTFWDTKGGSKFYSISPSVPSLFPGQTYDLKTATSIITLGESAGVEVKIDRFNKFKEINETNNAKIHYFNVQCKPELAPYDYTKTKPDNIIGNTKPDEPFTTTIWVYNNGGCQSKPAVLAIQGTGISFVSYDIPPIMKNNKIGIPISLKWTEPGTKNCEIKVDYTNTNNESIENNNTIKLIVSVTGEWPVQE
jgi:subtilase family serine protease